MKEMMNLMKANMAKAQTQTADQSTRQQWWPKRKNGKKSRKNTTTHPYANTATKNTPQNQKTSVGN
jgi:hypothetical protein